MLLERLAELERQTTPLAGEETAANKGRRAFIALETAGWIVRLTAGWAIDHQIGMAKRGLKFTPAATPRNREHPEYLELRQHVDDHQLERDGAALGPAGKLKPLELKTLLLNLLQANPGAFPSSLQGPLMDALGSLDLREATRFFQPASTAHKKRHRRLQLELWAYALVEYRVSAAGGHRRLAAQLEVAEAYGVTADALRKWGEKLRRQFGRLEVFRVIGRAHNIGTWADAAQRKRAVVPAWGEQLYGEAALNAAGKEYKSLSRRKKAPAAKRVG
jgi:hypothetical protein